MCAHDTPRIYTASTEPGADQFDAWSNQPLLTSLEQGGIDWPSSCRNGTCRTCMGQLVRGQVRYEIDWPGLSAEEKVAGYTLPCVAYPCSELVLSRGVS
jgi:ferredoxin